MSHNHIVSMSGISKRMSTGIPGLDRILHGGFIRDRNYMVRGEPGTGKTIMGMHFLMEGVENDETSLFINLEESKEDIHQNAETLGFDMEPVKFLDLSPDSEFFTEGQAYDIFPPEDVEQGPLTEKITARVEEVKPDRIFVDPLTQLRYLASGDYQFRKQVLSFMNFLKEEGATVLFASEETESLPDDDLQFISDGTINLSYAERGRIIDVSKFRGSPIESGHHSMRIDESGIHVYPELKPGTSEREFVSEVVSSGVPALDSLLMGGIERGTVTIISGPTGVGKTTTGTQFMKEAAGRGERSVLFSFEETRGTFLHRCESINIPVGDMIERGTFGFEEIEPLSLSAAEFSQRVRMEVEENDTEIIMIDGVEGYHMSLLGDDQNLTNTLHRLCRYLKNQGVTIILVEEIDNITGEFRATEYGNSYLADNIIYLRYLEVRGELRKSIGVLKKRVSDFERNMREFEISGHGIKVGERLTGLRGILSGTPEWVEYPQGGSGEE